MIPDTQLFIWQVLFLSISLKKGHQKPCALSWQGQQYSFIVLPQEYINSLVLYHNLVNRELDCISLPQDIMLVHCIGNIVLIEPTEEEQLLQMCWQDTCIREWKIFLTKIQRSSTFRKLSRDPALWDMWRYAFQTGG